MTARIKLVRALIIGMATVVLGMLSIVPRTTMVAPVDAAESAGDAAARGAAEGAAKGRQSAIDEYSSTGEEEPESSGGSCG